MATNSEIKAFIKTFGTLAVKECNRRIALGEGFPLPSVCMAQSALESDWGVAGLMKRANAFFGIKAGGSWKGKIYVADTWEVAENGEAYNTVANFRAYDSLEDSMRDYFDLIIHASRYKNALSYGTDKSQWKTARECVTAIWAAGYATDKLYVQKIMNTIEGRNLTEWDTKIDGSGAIVDNLLENKTFTFSDMLVGKLIESDGGRSFANDKTDLTSFAVNAANAITATGSGTYTITSNLEDPNAAITFNVWIAHADGTITKKGSVPNLINEGITLNVVKNDRIGFFFKMVGGEINFNEDTYGDLNVTFLSANPDTAFPSNDEIKKSALAFFVKIE